jgi:CTP synthase (UTP-ammonia lyase)
MNQTLKIAIVGDYNFTYYSHQATNLSLDHTALFLDVDINYYWIRMSEIATMKKEKLAQYDGFWIAPGEISNHFYLNGLLNLLSNKTTPVLITGEGFKTFVESFFNNDSTKVKAISENLVKGEVFEKIQIIPHSNDFIKLFEYHLGHELTSSRFSIYPQVLTELIEKHIDIEAFNQYEDPEIISLKNHPFYLACGYTPQVTSTREMPHPLIYTFIKACMAVSQKGTEKLAM